jgi:hypothetical protein
MTAAITLQPFALTTPSPALDALAAEISRAWCRSFRVASAGAAERLARRLGEVAAELVAAGTPFGDMRGALDRAAERILKAWFETVLGEASETSPTSFALLRLAFLDANGDGRWSDGFLDPAVDRRALAADLRAHLIAPVPPMRPRAMVRQSV